MNQENREGLQGFIGMHRGTVDIMIDDEGHGTTASFIRFFDRIFSTTVLLINISDGYRSETLYLLSEQS